MPIYEYECERCSLRFELKRRFSDNGSGFCPQCGSEAHRVFSPVPIIFKGSGFYVTDSRKKQPSDESEFRKDGTGTKSEGN
jgi:putative FmdB family regulatory protein